MILKNTLFVNAFLQHMLWTKICEFSKVIENPGSIEQYFNHKNGRKCFQFWPNSKTDSNIYLCVLLLSFSIAEWDKLYGLDIKNKPTAFKKLFEELSAKGMRYPNEFPLKITSGNRPPKLNLPLATQQEHFISNFAQCFFLFLPGD